MRTHWRPVAVLGLLFCLLLAENAFWLSCNDQPPMWDSAFHLAHAYQFLHYSRIGPTGPGGIFSLTTIYPPLFYMTLTPLLRLGLGPDAATVVHWPFLLVILLSVYALGWKIFRNRTLGVLAAALTVTFPHIQWFSREIMIDLEVVAFTTLVMALALASEQFERRRFAVYLGVAMGFGMLFKWSVLFYVGPPLLWYAIQAFRQAPSPEQRRSRANHFLLAVLIGGTIPWPWYLFRIRELVHYFLPVTQGLGKVEGDPGLWTLDGWLFYLRAMVGWQLFLPFTLLLVIALFLAVRERMPGLGLLAAWLIGPYLIFSLMANKAPRFMAPLLPAVALMLAWFAVTRTGKHWRWILGVGMSVLAVFQAVMVSFGIPWIPRSLMIARLDRPAFQQRIITCRDGQPAGETEQNWPDGWFVYNQTAYDIYGPPVRADWHINGILDVIRRIPLPVDQTPTLGLTCDCARFNVWSFRDAALRRQLDVRIWRISAPGDGGTGFEPYRFVLTKCGIQGPWWNTAANADSMAWILGHPDQFSEIGSWPLPDGSRCRLYLNRDAHYRGQSFTIDRIN